MPHLPVVLWVVIAIVPVVIGLLLLVEATVIRPAAGADRKTLGRIPAEGLRRPPDRRVD